MSFCFPKLSQFPCICHQQVSRNMIQSSGICGLLKEHTIDHPGVSDQEKRTNPITEQLRANQSRYLARGHLFRVKRLPLRAKKILQSISTNRVVGSVFLKLPCKSAAVGLSVAGLPFGFPPPSGSESGERQEKQNFHKRRCRFHYACIKRFVQISLAPS